MTQVLLSITAAIGDDVRQLVRNPVAFAGGLGGLGLLTLVVLAVTATASPDDAAAAVTDDDAFELDFAPGTLARLGEEPDERVLPQKIVTQDRRAPDPPAEPASTAAASTDETAPPTVKPAVDPRPAAPPAPRDDRDPRIPVGPKPTHANTPNPDDVATVDHETGDPFGDAEGWDDLMRAGDPWATEVMKKLANMKIGGYARTPPAGEFRFALTICKDGHIERVLDKGGTMIEPGRGAVKLALESLALPEPTAAIARAMPNDCARLRYTFVWTADEVE